MLAVALVVRVGTLLVMEDLPLFRAPDVDAAVYHQAARQIAAGDLAFGHAALTMSPGYFYFLAGIYRYLGDGPWAFRLVQAAFGMGLVALVWDTSRRMFGVPWATLTGLLAAAYGPFAFFFAVQLADGPAAFFHALLVWAAVATLRDEAPSNQRRVFGRLAGIGILLGLCADLRPNALLLAIPVAALPAWLLTGVRERMRGLLVLGLAAALTIAPITLRNWYVAEEAVLLSAHGGINFFIGNGPGATGTFRVPPEVQGSRGPTEAFEAYRAAAERAVGRPLRTGEADRYWFRRTMQYIAHDPWTWCAVLARKARLYLNGFEVWDVYHYDFYRALDRRLAWSLRYRDVAPMVLFGTVAMLRRGSRRDEKFVASIIVTTGLGLVLMLISARYRFAMIPAGLIACTATVRAGYEAAMSGNPRRVFAIVVGLVLCSAATWPIEPRHSVADEEYFKLGVGYHEEHRFADAEHAYRSSLRIDPDHLRSRSNLAVLYQARGEWHRALAEWRDLEGRARRIGDSALASRAGRQAGRIDARLRGR